MKRTVPYAHFLMTNLKLLVHDIDFLFYFINDIDYLCIPCITIRRIKHILLCSHPCIFLFIFNSHEYCGPKSGNYSAIQ